MMGIFLGVDVFNLLCELGVIKLFLVSSTSSGLLSFLNASQLSSEETGGYSLIHCCQQHYSA